MWFFKKNNKEDLTEEITPRDKDLHIESDKDDSNEQMIWMRRMISHNIKMPMSIISGYAELLKQGILSADDQIDAVNAINENVMYLSQVLAVIFDDNMDSSMPGSMDISKVNVYTLIERVIGYVKEIAKKNNIRIFLEGDKEAYIKAEQMDIMKVFYQILENSFKYLGEGNNIRIQVRITGDNVLVVYKDDGIGIPENEVEKVMQMGYRGSNSSSRLGKGLGMYDINETVKKYGGMMKVNSRENEGFTIIITFIKADK